MKTLCSILLFSCLFPAYLVGETPKPDADVYRQTVAPLFRKYCIRCHGPERDRGNLTLHDIDANLINGRQTETWRRLYEQLQFKDMPPDSAKQPSEDERRQLLSWIRSEFLKSQRPGAISETKLLLPQFGNYVDHTALFNPKAGPVIPEEPRIWRVRPSIYRDLIQGVARSSGLKGLASPFSLADGLQIKDYSARYFIDEPTTNMLMTNAERVVDFQTSERNNKYRELRALVQKENPATREQLIRAIQTQFRAVLRRSPRETETQRFLSLYEKVNKSGGHLLAAKTMLQGILMQPEALFRWELGQGKIDDFGRQRLSQREIAFALSFALGNCIDEKLLAAASNNKLATTEAVTKYVTERLKDPGKLGNPRIMQFFREYFGYPNVTEVFKDNPEFGAHVPKALLTDLELLVNHIVQKDRDVLKELLTTNRYFVECQIDRKTGKLTRYGDRKRSLEYCTTYGLPPDWKWHPNQPMALPKEERAGILTHPAWLVAWSDNFNNHPVQRGKWIRTHLLGGSVPDVPIGVDARIPEDKHKTLRARLNLVTHKAECWRCHNKMDPLGLPFEQYDHYGRYRRYEVDKPVITQGAISRVGVPSLEANIDNPIELVHRLANSEYVEQVFTRYVFRFFMGRNETLGDARTLQEAHRAYKDNQGSLRAMIVSLLSSDSFLYRKAYKD